MKQRILTAIAAFVIFIPFVVIGGTAFNVLVYLLASIALLELVRMRRTMSFFPIIAAVIGLWLIMLPGSADFLETFHKTEMITVLALLLLAYTVLSKNTFTFDDAGFVLLTVIYVGMGFFYLMVTRDGTGVTGLTNIFYVLLVIWTTDIGAYFCGRTLGKHKLWPEISPNKTIEGAAGGVILSVIVGIVFHIVFPFSYGMITVIMVTILTSAAGQIGDLVESAYKRHYDVKDSGKILPGHGGILDRLDSLVFVLPLLHVIQFFA
ncbi:phosphatidate cytidylyltransferase [Barrientosiimonas marina]|uniref:Phosphatidate cytidylyltransferase n=1 Tax=Lentibacillus kimchii TaxID=1542911 RepID=A0ABW2URV0_9BACI